MAVRKVLVVDDDKNVRKAIMTALDRTGFDPRGADGIDAAREALMADDFAAVVLDMRMPNPRGDISRAGFAVLETIATKCPRPAVVILTAYADEPNKLEAFNCGADAYLSKPNPSKQKKGREEIIPGRLPNILKEVLFRRNRVVSDQEIALDVDAARTLQLRGFPRNLSGITGATGLTVAGGNLPAFWVSGDTYYFCELTEKHDVAFMLCDVAGHGVKAALTAMRLQVVFQMCTKYGWPLAATDEALNESLNCLNDVEVYAEGVLGLLHTQSHRIEMLVAGRHLWSIVGGRVANPRPKRRRRGTTWGRRTTTAVVDGFDFSPGQSVVFFSDGLTDVRNSNNEEFGADRLHHAHRQFGGNDATELSEYVLYDAIRFADGILPRDDDMTVLSLHWSDV